MATFAFIHGGGDVGWDWHLGEPVLRQRGHAVYPPDLPRGDRTPELARAQHAVLVRRLGAHRDAPALGIDPRVNRRDLASEPAAGQGARPWPPRSGGESDGEESMHIARLRRGPALSAAFVLALALCAASPAEAREPILSVRVLANVGAEVEAHLGALGVMYSLVPDFHTAELNAGGTTVWIQMRTTRRDSLRTIVQKPTRLMRQRFGPASVRLMANSFMRIVAPVYRRAE